MCLSKFRKAGHRVGKTLPHLAFESQNYKKGISFSHYCAVSSKVTVCCRYQGIMS